MVDAPLLADLGDIPDGGHAIYVTASDGVRVRVAWWGGHKRGTVYLMPGRTEYIEKYCHVIRRLKERRFNVVCFDWRGQGLSDRPDDRLDIGHVEKFSDYQLDVAAALADDDIANLSGPKFLFAHSMGGAIGLRSIAQGLEVKAAVFSSPMWGLKHADILRPVFGPANLMARPFNKHKNLFPGTKPTFYVQVEPFEDNAITTDRPHWDMMKNHINQHEALGLGGPTIHWVTLAAKDMAQLRKLTLPNIPMLVLKAENEMVVDPVAIDKRMPTLPDARLETIAGAKHEIWMETPAIQTRVWSRTDAFLEDVG